MKTHFSKRVLVALLMLGVLAAAFASTALAGNACGHARRAGVRFSLGRVDGFAFAGDFGYRSRRPAPRGEACAVTNHPPHYWYDGRLYCAGQNADGSWRNPAYRCEDDYGRKKVNLPWWDPHCEPPPPCD